jgi:hypothetical protein
MRAVPKSEVYSLDGGRTLVMHPEIATQAGTANGEADGHLDCRHHHGAAAMTKLDEQTIKDLTNLALDRCGAALIDVLQMVDDKEQAAQIGANVAGVILAFAADELRVGRNEVGAAAYLSALSTITQLTTQHAWQKGRAEEAVQVRHPNIIRGRLTAEAKDRIEQLAIEMKNPTPSNIARAINCHPATVKWYMLTHGLLDQTPGRAARAYVRYGQTIHPYAPEHDSKLMELRTAHPNFPRRAIAEMLTEAFGIQRNAHSVHVRLILLAAAPDEPFAMAS